jgi:hypothetical protein
VYAGTINNLTIFLKIIIQAIMNISGIIFIEEGNTKKELAKKLIYTLLLLTVGAFQIVAVYVLRTKAALSTDCSIDMDALTGNWLVRRTFISIETASKQPHFSR